MSQNQPINQDPTAWFVVQKSPENICSLVNVHVEFWKLFGHMLLRVSQAWCNCLGWCGFARPKFGQSHSPLKRTIV